MRGLVGSTTPKRKKSALDTAGDEDKENFSTRRTDSVKKRAKTSVGHLDSFLLYLNGVDDSHGETPQHKEYDATKIPFEYFTKQTEIGLKMFCGQFSQFLCNTDSLGSAESVKQYMKGLKGQLRRDYPQLVDAFQDDKCKSWWMTMCLSVNIHFDKEAAPGAKLTNQAPALQTSDLQIMCRMEFAKGTTTSNETRCFLVTDTNVMGRVSETEGLTMEDFSWQRRRANNGLIRNHLCVSIDRSKATGRGAQLLSLLPHAYDWTICNIHSYATMLSMENAGATLKGNLFGHVKGDKNGSKRLNDILKRMSSEYEGMITEAQAGTFKCRTTQWVWDFIHSDNELTKDLKTHSMRRGGAQMAGISSSITADMIAARGNWAVSAIHKIYLYLTGNETTDLYVMRILAGYADPHTGGICPDRGCIPTEDLPAFKAFSSHLFRAVSGERTELVAMIEGLTCNLLQHHDSVKMEFLNHHLVVLVEELAKMLETLQAKK